MAGRAVAAEDDQISIGERIGELAGLHPDQPAIISVAPDYTRTVLTWAQLEASSNLAARGLSARGVTEGTPVGIALPTGIDHVISTLAAWKLGALVVPLNHESTEGERQVLADSLRDGVIVGTGEWASVPPAWWRPAAPYADTSPVVTCGTPRSASASGGSTGRPRIVIRRRPWVYPRTGLLSEADRETGLRFGQTQLVMLPMYHAGFTGLHHGLVLDHTIVLMERFVPSLFPRLVEEFRVNCLRIVPTMMHLILEVPDLDRYDLSSLEAVHQGAGPCLPSVKRRWLELVPPEILFEDYSSVERLGLVTIRGDEWLAHPGSVGRPANCEVRIFRDDGSEAAPGEIGEIYLRSATSRQPDYLGDGPPLRAHGDFLTLGDAGYLDEQGYLHLVGRTSDLINVGGANVYAAEVELVLLDFPGVRDAAVSGRPHEYLGEAVHARIVPVDPDQPPTSWQLDEHCRKHLSLAKIPLSYEFVENVGRTSAGKLRRPAVARV